MRKIEVATGTPTEFDVAYTDAGTQKPREEREQKEREEAEKQQGGTGRKPGGWKFYSHTQRR